VHNLVKGKEIDWDCGIPLLSIIPARAPMALDVLDVAMVSVAYVRRSSKPFLVYRADGPVELKVCRVSLKSTRGKRMPRRLSI